MKSYIKFFLIYLFLISIVLTSCDQVSNPFTKGASNKPADSTGGNVKKIFLEIYTGFTCGNCPAATDLAEQLDSIYPNRIVLMEIHAGSFAKPSTAHPYDFRTLVGDELNKYFGADQIGNPNGTVDRKSYNGNNPVMYRQSWDGAIQQELNIQPIMTIDLTPYLNIFTNTLDVKVNIKYLQDGNPSHYLSVYLVEDSIVQYQTDYRLTDPNIEDYVHDNILRASLNGTWGDQISSDSIKAGNSYKMEYHYIIPTGKDWRLQKLGVIAFVHNRGSSDEVFQVERENNLILVY